MNDYLKYVSLDFASLYGEMQRFNFNGDIYTFQVPDHSFIKNELKSHNFLPVKKIVVNTNTIDMETLQRFVEEWTNTRRQYNDYVIYDYPTTL